MSSRSGLKCSMKPVGECGNIRPATHGDTIEWCLELNNTSKYTIEIKVRSYADCMPEIDPATMAWVPTQTGGATGAASPAAGPILSNTLTMPPMSTVTYEITADVRDDALCPSWVVNSADVFFETEILGKPELLCKSVCSDPVAVGTDDVDWDIYPCDPKVINIDEHAWQFMGGGDMAEHAKLTQFLAEGVTLAGVLRMLKSLFPAEYAAMAAPRCSSRPEDNISWPPKRVLDATAVIGVGPPFEGGPGEQP